ncbi:peptide-methionine (R)-S-oxide reductase, partial [Candidatus Microgenomates bacterium]|nr:peptide-methionine (R)-S-oxide reductase [Candidatus Microgenomates bacterium]
MKNYFLGAGIIIVIVIVVVLYKTPIVKPAQKNTIVRSAKTTNAEWKQILSPLEYHILRESGTEIPFTGALLHEKRKGTYVTADCGDPVFFSEQKYDSKTGWPSFWAPIKSDSVVIKEDTSLCIKRFEVL